MADQPSPKPKNDTIIALELAWELGYMIALPLVIFVLIGRYVDHVFSTSPLFILIGVLIAFIISSYFVWQKTTTISAELEKYSKPTSSPKPKKKIK